MDTGNSALAIDCPHCGLLASRFSQYCRNCGYSIWPNGRVASAAFRAWKSADPARARARQYDVVLPLRAPYDPEVPRLDYDARAHQLGIHLFPTSNYPFLICVGFFFLALAVPPFNLVVRIAMLVIGLLFFLGGVVGWVVLEDSKMYVESTRVGPAEHAPEERL